MKDEASPVILRDMTIQEKLLYIQEEIKVPKGHKKDGINYTYRTAEEIMNIVKPLCRKYGCVITITDEVLQFRSGWRSDSVAEVDGRRTVVYAAEPDADVIVIKATAKMTTIEAEDSEVLESSACAAVTLHKKGMDNAQSFGSSSSYARKYALGGLLLLDDAKDPDDKEVEKDDKGTNEKTKATEKAKAPATPPKPKEVPKAQAPVNPIAEAITNYYGTLTPEKQEATLAAINRYKSESNVKTIGELPQDKLQELYAFIKDVNKHVNP